jgi:hypothetical protein
MQPHEVPRKMMQFMAAQIVQRLMA